MSTGAPRRQTAWEWAAEQNAAPGENRPARDEIPETADDIADRTLGVRVRLTSVPSGGILGAAIALPPAEQFSVTGRGWAPHTFVLQGDAEHGLAGRIFEFMWNGRTHDGVHNYIFLREHH